jgi:transcriptional regulator with XRE-family HTH domain
MIPSFNEDPVAVRLGFRDGPEEARIYGPTVQAAREAAGLTKSDIAIAVSAAGHTVDVGWVSSIEDGTWHTVATDVVAALASALGAPARGLGSPGRPEGPLDQIALSVVHEHEHLSVARFESPFAEQFPRRLLVSFLDLRVLLIICDSDAERIGAVDFAVHAISDAAQYAAIVTVRTDDDLTCWVVRPEDVLSHFAVPGGRHTGPTLAPQLTSTILGLAMAEIVQGQVVRWHSFAGILGARVDADTRALRDGVSAAARKKFRSSATRVAADRKDAFLSVGDVELGRVNDLIDSTLADTDMGDPFDPATVLDNVERAS